MSEETELPGLAARVVALIDKWRFSLLLALLIGVFFFGPIAGNTAVGDVIETLLFALIFAAVIHLARDVMGNERLGLLTVLFWAVITLLSQNFGVGGPLTALTLLFTLALTAWMTACTLSLLLFEAKADGDALAGAVFGYFLMALLWTLLFTALEFSTPGSIALPENSPQRDTDLLYFSLVTLTTLGYGDVLPISPFAKIMAGLEAAIGTLYLAILIGRIVGALKVPVGRVRAARDAEAERRAAQER